MIQVGDVPEQVHRTLKARAAREGMSLSDLFKKELERAAEHGGVVGALAAGEADPS